MTRKDYELIASCLKQGNCSDTQVRIFAVRLKKTNPAFDTVRFIKAATQEKATQ